MPPKPTPSLGNQTTLLGYFGKKVAGPAATTPSSAPSSSASSSTPGPSTSAKKTPTSKSTKPTPLSTSSKEPKAPASHSAYNDTPSHSTTASSPLAPSSSRRVTEPAPSTAATSALASSPLSEEKTAGKSSQASSPLTLAGEDDVMNVDDDDEDDEQPMKKPVKNGKAKAKEEVVDEEKMDVDDGEESDQPIAVSSTRNSKRKKPISYIDASSTDSDSSASPAKKPRLSTNGKKKAGSKKKKKDDDEYSDDAYSGAVDVDADSGSEEGGDKGEISEEDFGDWDDEALASAMSDFETPAKKTKAKGKSTAKASKPTRPPAKPLASGAASSNGDRGGGSYGGGSGSLFMTQAEKNRIEAKEKKEAEQDVFEFLKDIKDKEGNRPGDASYDPRTLKIPKSSWAQMSPFETQFWEIKQNHFDVVLFFQKGKFYELYENDADIGHREFDLKLTGRVKMRMVGVPEGSFDYWAAKFLAAGYKVGKVEQAETAIAKEMRTKNGGGNTNNKADKIVRRELASVLTNGTVVDAAFVSGDEASHCLAIKESVSEETGFSSFGVCILDAPTGKFDLTAFDDDACFTRLETLMRQLKPKEVIHEKGNLSSAALQLLKSLLPYNTSWIALKPATEFFDSETTKQKLDDFFNSDVAMDGSDAEGGIPPAIVDMLDKDLAIESLGGMIFYLSSLNIEKDLLSQRSFDVYDPIRRGKCLVLDGQTLSHLEILMNNEGDLDGTLLQLLERTITPFGKRLFRIWLTVPLVEVEAIEARLDAVQDLMNHPNFATHFKSTVKDMPDMERCMSRIHARKCKKADFLKVIDSFRRLRGGFGEMRRACSTFENDSTSNLIKGAPDLSDLLKGLDRMFFISKEGAIQPKPGASQACDDAVADAERIEAELEEILKGYQKKFKNPKLKFWHSNIGAKEVYHLEVPAGTAVPPSWAKNSSTKAYERYMTPEVKPLAREVQEARETRKMVFADFYEELLGAFDKDRETWLRAVKVIAELDCLLSLAKSSSDLDEPRCRPEIVESEQAFFDFKDLRHPALCLRDSGFISNNVQLGGKYPRQTLLTGPNTAGKSTICRQTAVAVIMAQLGCFVPASSARISPIDRIQTRMGAYDNMFSNSSTFKVELDEAGKMLREAGPKSLIILDELGRGTSTWDGSAIATAVMHQIATHTLPLGFFATHYGSLTDDFKYHPNIRLMHMQTQVDDAKREVICLYKLIAGKAKSSYGTHIAHLAGLPDAVVTRAEQISKEFSADFKAKMQHKRRSDLSVLAQADFTWLMKLAKAALNPEGSTTLKSELEIVRECIPRYGS